MDRASTDRMPPSPNRRNGLIRAEFFAGTLSKKTRKFVLAATILVDSHMAAHPHPNLRSPDNRSELLRIEVHRLLGFILRRPIADDENPSRATEPGWDSLKHVELVFLIEDHFGMRFLKQEIATLEDARGIEAVVEARRAEPEKDERGAACGTV